MSKSRDKLQKMKGTVPQESEENLPTIGLSIIVKDEEEVIERMLESVYHILDYYTIVDTGSTDNTKKVIKDFFDEKGVEGQIIDHPFKNFEDARNTALQAAKDKTDFSFWLDADEQLVCNEGFDVKLLKQSLKGIDEAQVPVQYNAIKYNRLHFYSNDRDYYWEGPVHEVISCDDPDRKAGVISGIHILVKAEGASWTKQSLQEKYEEHAQLLKDYIYEKEENYKPRWIFYLAQSYRDAGNTDENNRESIKWYQERIRLAHEKNKFDEEVYYSQLMIGKLKERLKYTLDEIFNEYFKCSEYDQLRAEHFLPVINILQMKKNWEQAYIISSYAMKFHKNNPYPKRVLFLDPSVYEYKIADLHTLSCYWSGRKQEGTRTFRKIWKKLQRGEIQNPNDRKRIANNKEFFI